MTAASTPPLHQPVAADARVHVLDVLRGLSLFGILQANVLVLSGLLFVTMVGELTLSPLDEAVGFVIEALVHGKFYSLFSLLFGIGFHVFLSRAEARSGPAKPLFRRRLWLLLACGFLHATLLWSGDILMLYAMLGFALIPFYGMS